MNTILTTLKLNRTAWTAFFVSLAAAFIMSATAHAQSPATTSANPEDAVKKYNISFPISQLGSCTNYTSCRTFCEDPLNQKTCIDFAKSKGFYKEPEVLSNKSTILAAAKTSLGCDSATSCLNFCSVPANQDKCNSFAHTQNISGGVISDPTSAPILIKAKEVLGCSSPDACKSFCEQEANRAKCGEFANQTGLHGGEHRIGPGGCTSEASCKAFCSDPNNYQICSGFTATAGQSFTGPGGCNNEVSCRSYCQQHPSDCRSFGSGAGQGGPPAPGYSPAEMCNRTPNCSWSSNGCQCGFYGETKETSQKAQQYAAYCQANPNLCRVSQSGGFDTNQQRQQFENYCTQNPEKCQTSTTATTTPVRDSFDQSVMCVRYGCSWTNNTCQCTGIRETYHESKESQEAACKAGGGTCNFSGDICNCQGYKYSYPTPYGGGTYSYPTPGTNYSYPTPYSGGNYSPGPYPYPTPGSTYSYPTPASNTDAQRECSTHPSCTWTGSYCQCASGYTYPTPYTYGGGTYPYPTPSSYNYTYPTPSSYNYSYPTPYSGGGTYPYPTPYSGGTYSYPSPSSYTYPTPQAYTYPTPQAYTYPTPQAYTYPTPQAYTYPTPQAYTYPTPQAYTYPTPQAYSYPTPQAYSYPTPQAYSYPTPQSYSYPTPSSGVHGISTSVSPSLWDIILSWFK